MYMYMMMFYNTDINLQFIIRKEDTCKKFDITIAPYNHLIILINYILL